ncbi:ribosome hibernation factor-recruiting GTPase MRF [Gordonia zhaorongruii]|uniref:ribosome hibernation factor-recruiting GTPase MRF n=1 Tax=Gordonia zhaorongruii TaxID=2597659 RepID=UPI00104FA082|nr:GTP-binding protein [Gordonia zhaorongruii]
MPHDAPRTPVVLVGGLHRTTNARIAYALLQPGTVVISHDLRDVASGRVTRIEHRMSPEGTDTIAIDDISLEHGCVSCTLRLDLLPMLRTLHHDSGVERIVVLLDPIVEPERLSAEIMATVVDVPASAGLGALPSGPASIDVFVESTLCGVDARSWLDDATGDITVTEAGMTGLDDERTVAQVAISQLRFADAIVIESADGLNDAFALMRLHAVVLRLAPGAGMRTLNSMQPLDRSIVHGALESIGDGTPNGRPMRPFDPLLAGSPSLDADCGVQLTSFEADRPFHPERLHDALDVLLDGVVQARGRMWLASDPDDVMWLESAGGALGISHVGTWIACVEDPASVDAEHRALASLRWHPEHGDRHSSITVLCHRADPMSIHDALREALVTDEELARGPAYITSLPSPFGHAHRDPCDDMDITTPEPTVADRPGRTEGDEA